MALGVSGGGEVSVLDIADGAERWEMVSLCDVWYCLSCLWLLAIYSGTAYITTFGASIQASDIS